MWPMIPRLATLGADVPRPNSRGGLCVIKDIITDIRIAWRARGPWKPLALRHIVPNPQKWRALYTGRVTTPRLDYSRGPPSPLGGWDVASRSPRQAGSP